MFDAVNESLSVCLAEAEKVGRLRRPPVLIINLIKDQKRTP
jgi:hypothetical protein